MSDVMDDTATAGERMWRERAERDAAALHNRLRKNERRLRSWRKRQNIDAWRLYDHDVPEVPLLIDRYGGALAVSTRFKRRDELAALNSGWLEVQLAAIADQTGVSPDDIFTRSRRRAPGGQQTSRIEHDNIERIAVEAGLKFSLNMSDYLDPGLFLDHRIARARVRELARGKRVLNLFAYTGAFSVYAAAGGAAETLSVDASRRYLERLDRNMALNGFTMGQDHNTLRTDINQWFKRRDLERSRWDIIILDPPTYSRSRHREDDMDIQRDHPTLIAHSLSLLAEGGYLLFSTNHQSFTPDKSLETWGLSEVSAQSASPDFRGHAHRAWWKGPTPF